MNVIVCSFIHRNSDQTWLLFLFNWLLFGLLLAASWYVHPLFSLVCFVPYMQVLFQARKNAVYYLQLYILNLSWNTAVTYWICQLKLLKGLATLLTNSMLFLLPVLIWHLFLHRGCLKKGQALLLLVCWLLFEYLHHLWDFSWTWLTVGNVFGSAPQWVLWYAYVGVLGGSAWILSGNYLLYNAARSADRRWKKWLPPALAVLIPVASSLVIGSGRSVQPAGAVSRITAAAIAIHDKDSIRDTRKINLIDSLLVADTVSKGIVLLPEVLLTDHIWLDRFPFSRQYAAIKQSLNRWKANHVIFGAQLNVADSLDQDSVMPASKARYQARAYNAAMMIDTSDFVSIKLKKVLVPVEEYVPPFLSFLGLQTNGYAIEYNNADVFMINGREYLIGICYEVVNSIFTSSRVGPQTSAILMLSSESFFGPSEVGREQYMNICRLRCVENNLPLVKSPNDGIALSVAAGGAVLEAERISVPRLMHAAVHSPGVSFYYRVVPAIPWVLLLLLAIIWLVNVFANVSNNRYHRAKKSRESVVAASRLSVCKDDVIKT